MKKFLFFIVVAVSVALGYYSDELRGKGPVTAAKPAAEPQQQMPAPEQKPANPFAEVSGVADPSALQPGLYAVFNTAKGRIVARLFEDKAPLTVANFTELAEGKKEWIHPVTGQKMKTRFYDGLTFMRVIPGFMIQGGDPLNNTSGGPGYKFQDEFSADLSFNKPGLLAMANSGPNTNGSQFFITDRPRPPYDSLPSHLTNRHAIFGEVVEGMDVVSAIADVPAQNGMAYSPVAIQSVAIMRVQK